MIASREESTDRLRLRPDLMLFPHEAGGLTVKDPISLEYFQFGPREAWLLERLRNPCSIQQLHQEYRKSFPGERLTPDDLLAFCSSLHHSSLLLTNGATDQESDQRRSSGWREAIGSPLAIRLPGIDPSRVLDRTEWFGRLVFSKGFFWLLCLLAVLLGVFSLGEADSFVGDLARLVELSDPSYLIAALVALALTKTWHELGHAIACRRMGGECHELGVLLLVFVPCLYCDVSDAWTFRSRWRRALVALGGVYFEAILAVAALACWLALEPGFLRVLALYVAVIGSASSLLVNLNPLVRFDGYYLLADVWGVSNLHGQSRRALWGSLTNWIAGRARAEQAFDAPRPLLACYAAASILYTTALLVAILWALHQGLASVSMRPLGDLLVAVTLLLIVARWAHGVSSLIASAPRYRRAATISKLCAAASIAGLAAWAIGSIEVEQTLWSRCRIEGTQSASIRVREAGLLSARVSYGQHVSQGDVIAEVHDPQRELRRLELLETCLVEEKRIAGLKARVTDDPTLFSNIAQAQTRLAEARRQLSSHEERTDRLVLRSPIAGRVLSPAIKAERSDWDEAASWTGAPLAARNDGCGVEPGESLCLIAGEKLRAVVLLDQHDCGLVRVGDTVRVALDRDPSSAIDGRVEAVSLEAVDPRAEHSDLPQLAVEPVLRDPLDEGGVYRVSVSIDAPTIPAQPGAIGQARIITGKETLLDLCQRWLRRTLRFG